VEVAFTALRTHLGESRKQHQGLQAQPGGASASAHASRLPPPGPRQRDTRCWLRSLPQPLAPAVAQQPPPPLLLPVVAS
jgi:hypothetical protein